MSAVTAPTCVGAVLFTDLVGFTEFNEVVGDAQAVGVLDAQTSYAKAALQSHADARLVKELGDGLMLWFADAGAAITAALELMRSIETARQDGSFPLAIRMGIHHGEAVARGDDVVGQTVNIASRISDLAGPGELLVSDVAIGDALDHNGLAELDCAPIGPVQVKGVSEPIWLQRVLGLNQSSGR
ncbi:MAG: adenylate/guanylate cyclase domain-containing protein [Acidimicrobiales bacterium]